MKLFRQAEPDVLIKQAALPAGDTSS